MIMVAFFFLSRSMKLKIFLKVATVLKYFQQKFYFLGKHSEEILTVGGLSLEQYLLAKKNSELRRRTEKKKKDKQHVFT